MDYAGAIYRVISRGNYRKNLFTVEEGSVAFERAFLKMVERCGWELLAYMESVPKTGICGTAIERVATESG